MRESADIESGFSLALPLQTPYRGWVFVIVMTQGGAQAAERRFRSALGRLVAARSGPIVAMLAVSWPHGLEVRGSSSEGRIG